MEKNQNIGYTILHSTKTITISRAFEKKTNTVDSPEYKVLLKLMHDFGHYTFEYKSSKKIEKETYGKLTYNNMRAYIRLQHPDKAEFCIAQLEQTIALFSKRSGSYARVKQWFLMSFPTYKEDAKALDLEGYVKSNMS